jgi:hypothetical protein
MSFLKKNSKVVDVYLKSMVYYYSSLRETKRSHDKKTKNMLTSTRLICYINKVASER